jgi:two-component system, NarL family, response regulator NreC
MASQLRASGAISDARDDAGHIESLESPAQPIRVVLADDHAQMRRSLRQLLQREDVLEVIAEETDLAAVQRVLDRHRPRVLVLDLGMYGGSSIGAIRRLRKAAPGTRIVLLTMDDDPVFAQLALDAGASGFVLKEMADADLPEAIVRAARGATYVSPRARARLHARSAVRGDSLTSRETEVLRLIALGHTSVEIAAMLRLSPRTVETHRARIYRKLGLSTRAQVVQYALGRDLLGA